ncbi:succinate-semialdehyde dehydrogenase/glutarate-semialdehyde dehydrogenase, partial [Paracidovorax anthurii]
MTAPTLSTTAQPLVRSQHCIAGQWQPAASGATFPVTDPATGAVIAHVPDGGAQDARA